MQLSALLTIAVATTTASACTFAMISDHNQNTGDGSGGGGCSIFINDKDMTKDDIGNGDVSFTADGTCSEGCDTVEYNGKKWEFCHSILGPFESDITGSTSISVRQVDNDGDTLSIYPGGDTKHFSSLSPFDSLMTNYFFRSGISC